MTGIRTPERTAMMLAEYPNAIDAVEFHARLNSLPGPPISSVHGVRVWAAKLGLHKSPEIKAALLRSWSAAGGRATSAIYAGRRGEALALRWTPERVALMRAEYPDATDPHALLASLNALPGLPVKHIGIVSLKALRMGLAKTEAARLAIGSQNGRRCVERGTLTRKRTSPRTAERAALMMEFYPTTPRAEMLDMLNALPGPALSGHQSMTNWAWILKLKRIAAPRPAFVPPSPPPMRKRRIPPPVAPSPVERFAAPIGAPSWAQRITQDVSITPPEDLTPEQQAELVDRRLEERQAKARAMLARRIAPDKVRAQTRLPLREVYRLAMEVRT